MLAALLISAIVTTNSPDTAVIVRTQVRERLEEMRAVHEQNRQEVQERVQESREDWEQEREHFRQRLELVRDEHKQALTQALQDRIENTHRRWVEHWSIVLDRLSQILDKAEARDGSEQVASLIAAARTKIATAQNCNNNAYNPKPGLSLFFGFGLGKANITLRLRRLNWLIHLYRGLLSLILHLSLRL